MTTRGTGPAGAARKTRISTVRATSARTTGTSGALGRHPARRTARTTTATRLAHRHPGTAGATRTPVTAQQATGTTVATTCTR